jgi:UDP-N-acetylmuramyl pentapeptide phosphotransferase/UDP-N-acetylglucosamine-1-phosphate transferase
MVAAACLAFGCWVFLAAGEALSIRGLPAVFLFALVMSVLGFWDDFSGLSPLFRFLVQLVAAIFLLWSLAVRIPEVTIAGAVLPKAVLVLAGAVWAVWMLNLYNFMDGIDGIAGGEAALASSFFFLVFAWYGESGWAVANLFIAAASMGFLVHNWPPARVFMGDAGSAFLGAFYGMQSVVAALATPVPFLVLVLPFSNFILDTTVTLFRRMLSGEKWYQAHRSHFYQRMTNLGMSHAKVTGLELASVAVSCLAAVLVLASSLVWKIVAVAVVSAGFVSAGVLVSRNEDTQKQGRS